MHVITLTMKSTEAIKEPYLPKTSSTNSSLPYAVYASKHPYSPGHLSTFPRPLVHAPNLAFSTNPSTVPVIYTSFYSVSFYLSFVFIVLSSCIHRRPFSFKTVNSPTFQIYTSPPTYYCLSTRPSINSSPIHQTIHHSSPIRQTIIQLFLYLLVRPPTTPTSPSINSSHIQ